MKVWRVNGFKVQVIPCRGPWRIAAWEGRFRLPDGRESIGYEDTLGSLRRGLHLFTTPESVARFMAIPRDTPRPEEIG